MGSGCHPDGGFQDLTVAGHLENIVRTRHKKEFLADPEDMTLLFFRQNPL
jgi:hypothetical protein